MDAPIDQLVSALEARHLADLTRSEVGRALRALSSCYVERRGRLASGGPLETAGKRAAFALYYGPLHFVIASAIVRDSHLAAREIGRIHDLGCGTGVGGAAWALECASSPFVTGTDRSAWAVEEANWLYRQMSVRGRAARIDLSRALRPFRRPFGTEDALLFAYSVNELPSGARSEALAAVESALKNGCRLLVIEPIATRLGNAGWWEEWRTVLAHHDVEEREWRFPAALLPESTRSLGRGAGLRLRELTARTLIR